MSTSLLERRRLQLAALETPTYAHSDEWLEDKGKKKGMVPSTYNLALSYSNHEDPILVPATINDSMPRGYDGGTGKWGITTPDNVRSVLRKKYIGDYIDEYKTLDKLASDQILSIARMDQNEDFPKANADWVVLKNGVYNWRTDEFKEDFDPGIFALTSFPNVSYDPNATCDVFIDFLKAIYGDDTVQFLLAWIGYTFCSHYDQQNILVIVGAGGIGKGVTARIWQHLLGDGNYSTVSLEQLTGKNNRFMSSQLYQKVANFDADLKAKYLGDSDILKQATGGDMILAEFKNKDPFSFTSYAKMIFEGNGLPIIRDVQGASIRRFQLVKPIIKSKDEYPKEFIQLDQRLKEPENASILSGIFNEAMRAYRRNIAQDNRQIIPTAKIEEDTAEWIHNGDAVYSYLFGSDRVDNIGTDDATEKTSLTDVYADFKEWAKEEGLPDMPFSRTQFGNRLKELGIEIKNPGNRPMASLTAGKMLPSKRGALANRQFNVKFAQYLEQNPDVKKDYEKRPAAMDAADWYTWQVQFRDEKRHEWAMEEAK